MADIETGLNSKKEHVVFPSDFEEIRATLKGKSYVRIRSGSVKTYTPEEIEIFSKNHPETHEPFIAWWFERTWHWVVDSKSATIRGGK